MEKVRPRCGQPSDRGRLKNGTEHNTTRHRYCIANTLYRISPPWRGSAIAKVGKLTYESTCHVHYAVNWFILRDDLCGRVTKSSPPPLEKKNSVAL